MLFPAYGLADGRVTIRQREDIAFAVLIVAISIGFAWILLPFFGAILWAVVAAILFAPLVRRLSAIMPARRGLAAFGALMVIVLMVIVPAIILGSLLIQEAAGVYAQLRSGQVDFGRYFEQMRGLLPGWADALLVKFGLTDFATLREMVNAAIASRLQLIAAQALTIGQGALSFLAALSVMLYLTFFLLRDGSGLAKRIEEAVPLHPDRRRALLDKFATVIRATVKGSLIVALIQGLIGGIVLWALGVHGAALWGTAMAFMSLLPAIGTGLIWAPIAAYLLATGAVWQGIVLILCGVLVIGMVDNLLRPILVGRDVKMPDYVVLISTLGGLQIFGINGFVIGPVIAALFMAVWTIAISSGPPVTDDPV
jgi:predicted PurR-regulated permease PerM